AFGLEMRRVPRPERERRVREALELVGLSTLADRYPRRMSGGQQQRVALARALVIRPSVLLLDEPLSNLDAKLREEMQVELRQIQQTVGTTTILVTHDQGEAMALSDRIVVMNRGRAEHVARPTEIYRAPATAFVANFLGKINVLPVTIANGAARIGTGGGRTPWLLAGPALLLFIGTVLAPIAMTLLLSFHDWGQYKGIETIITLKNWREIATDSYFFEIFLRTFRIALLTTVISVL